VLGDPNAVTAGKLCDEFERNVKAHPEAYRGPDASAGNEPAVAHGLSAGLLPGSAR
jgi:hypothetical protein